MRVAVELKPQAALSASSAAATPSPSPTWRSLGSKRARPSPTHATLVAAYQVTVSSVATDGFTAQASSRLTQRKAKTQRPAFDALLRESQAVAAQLRATASAAKLSFVRNGVYWYDRRRVRRTSPAIPASTSATCGAAFQLRFGAGRSSSVKSTALAATPAAAMDPEERAATRMATFAAVNETIAKASRSAPSSRREAIRASTVAAKP